MYSINLGCLLEINDDTEKIQLITGKGIETITIEDFDFRQNIKFFQNTVSRGDIKTWNSLKDKNLLLYAQTIEELYECIKNLHPVRKGIRLKSDNKTYIVVNSLIYESTALQSFLWQNANGKKSLSELFLLIKNKDLLNNSHTNKDFIENVVGLIRTDALYLLH